jgi:hypothetical protein
MLSLSYCRQHEFLENQRIRILSCSALKVASCDTLDRQLLSHLPNMAAMKKAMKAAMKAEMSPSVRCVFANGCEQCV